MKITIAGAGIGGLAAAIALRQDGHEITVGERAPEITEVGAGIQISPNGMAVMRALGLEEALAAKSVRAEAVELMDGLSGRAVTALNLKRDASDLYWILVHRADLIDVLLTSV
ncbi:MAG: FAD-dependent monooxygenase, partial [Litoreibacter sp.]